VERKFSVNKLTKIYSGTKISWLG